MNILFVNRAPRKIGSSRIWVYDLCEYLKEIGHNADICPEPISGKFDAVVLGKGAFSPDTARAAKRLNPDTPVGWINASINPSDDIDEVRQRLSDVDFLLVGSIEERDSLLPYKTDIIIFPLVEKLYTRTKKHTDHSPIVIGYHGNAVHLAEFFPHATTAIELLAREIPLRLIAIHPPIPGRVWTTGKPNIEVEQVPWDLDTIEDQLLRCDIGIIPGVTPITNTARAAVFKMLGGAAGSETISGYDTDYLLRFKNKSNAGRSFVFHQLHIPVVAAFMPSHFHILGNPECGFLAHTTEGWLDGLQTLARSVQTRIRVAKAAAHEFERQYDPHRWTERLCRQITALSGR